MNVFQQAWDELWEGCLARQKSEYKWKGSDGHYITASDLADKVRDKVTGKTWYSGRAGGKWLNEAREWLAEQVVLGRLQRHNFGRCHVSGMRYRPVDVSVTETEFKTMNTTEARRGRPKPCHYSRNGSRGGGPLCTANRKRSWYGGRSHTWCTRDKEQVTCVRCKNLLAKADVDVFDKSQNPLAI